MSYLSPSRKRRRRDITFPLVLVILLLIPFVVDEMFVRLKQALRAGGGITGFLDYPDLRANVRPILPQHCRSGGKGDPSWPDCDGKSGNASAGTRGEQGGQTIPAFNPHAGSGVAALAELERAEYEQLRALREARGQKPRERGVPVEPRPSNPSRYFPEPRHPMLSSGVPLTTSPDEPHWVDPPPREAPKEKAPPAREIASVPPAPPQAPRQESPRATAPLEASLPPWPHYQAAQQEAPRLNFRAERRPSTVKSERTVEVCGRMVPESRAASAALECAPREAEKPKEIDEGGNQTIFLP